MITEIVIRYAKEIQEPNDIANFSNRYGITMDGVSAISWEAPDKPRKKFSESLLKKMFLKLTIAEIGKIVVLVCFSSEQPNSAIVRHKKTWGLLGERGVKVENINNKNNYALESNSGLVLIGRGDLDVESEGVIESLINTNENIYFIVGGDKILVDSFNDIHFKKDWMEDTCKNGGIIFMPLGYADEPSCEVVAFGKNERIRSLHSC